MVAWNEAGELRNAALGRGLVPAALADRERKVRREFWAKIKRVLARVPFAEDLVAAYYCALDPETPLRVRGMLFAAIAYFILPGDFIPDIIAGLGFADDMALVTAVVGMVASHITPVHRAAAARALGKGGPAAASAAD
ncbi:MAG TPA: YkvA family protein [Methyloceanibacter sp.]|nr:YkvA family protein [Methyloceanibacter sp.]